MAVKYGVTYEKVQLNWAFLPKENAYGICNLRMEGAGIMNSHLVDKDEGEPITLYAFGSVKKKSKEVNKKEVQIPLYLNENRSGQISSFGENTNLLAKVSLESK